MIRDTLRASMNDKLTDFATRYAAAWSSQNPASLASFYAENGSLTVNGGTPSVGRVAITATARGYMTAFPDMVVKMDDVSQDGGHAVFRWTWTGTNTGPGGTGKSVRIRGHEEWTIGADGLIAESKGQYDDAEYQRQLNQMKRTWPDDWESRKRGDSCPFCENLYARSFHSGRASEAILEGNAIANGHAAVVFRGRHVAAFTDLSSNELADFSQDIQTVGLIIERAFRPCHVNYLLLGNIVPHLHVHVVPRYLDDAAPERPLPWNPSPVPEKIFAEQFRLLREAASSLRAE